jgi:3-oxoacyl-[acyl-carrier protein] reductase
MIGFTKALAKEVASRGITVNALAPGFIETEMTEGLSAEYRAKLLATIPLGRFGTPTEIARIAAFLLSEDARYITGQVLQADGGLVM